MNLDMGMLTQAQGRTFSLDKRDEQTQNLKTGTKRENQISDSEQSEIISSSENNENGIGEGLKKESDNKTPHEANDFLDNDSIQIQFEHLNKAQICSEISIAYTEILDGFKDSSLTVEELSEVL